MPYFTILLQNDLKTGTSNGRTSDTSLRLEITVLFSDPIIFFRPMRKAAYPLVYLHRNSYRPIAAEINNIKELQCNQAIGLEQWENEWDGGNANTDDSCRYFMAN